MCSNPAQGCKRRNALSKTTYITTIPSDLANTTNDINTLITSIYPDLERNHKDNNCLMERAILAPLNESANDNQLKAFTAISRTSQSSVNDVDEATLYPVEFLNSLQPAGLPSHRLDLKVRMPLMVVCNLALGISNGTRLILKRMMEKCPETVIATRLQKKRQQLFLPMLSITPSDTSLPFQFTKLQFPVKLCMAMTINKSQGQTSKVAGLHLQEPCFSHGQLYVRCNRVSSNKNLFICSETRSTKNVVYEEVL